MFSDDPAHPDYRPATWTVIYRNGIYYRVTNHGTRYVWEAI